MPHPALAAFLQTIGDVPVLTDPATIRRMSRDMSAAFSPVLKREAEGRVADVIVIPRDRTDLHRIAAAATRSRLPVMPRGAGSCNFGQSIPLQGGAVVDLTRFDRLLWQRGPVVRAECGIRLGALDEALRPSGWELRMHPSTRRIGTLGGYLGGGHAGVGSCQYGILRDTGNILGLRMLSMEETPREIELRGSDVNLVHHAYGANGLILEAEMPLAPAWAWEEAIVCFEDMMQAVRFSHALMAANSLVKKLISIQQWPLPAMMKPLAPFGRPGEHMVLCMVARDFFGSFEILVSEFGGRLSCRAAEGDGPYGAPLYEFSFGHTRLQINKHDRSQVSLVGLYRDPDAVGAIARSVQRFRDVGPMHLEAKRMGGHVAFQGAPVFPYVDDAQLARISAEMEEDGAQAANNHTFLVRENGMKPVDDIEIAFKHAMDPYNLLNPGKLTIDPEMVDASAGARFGNTGWWPDRAVVNKD